MIVDGLCNNNNGSRLSRNRAESVMKNRLKRPEVLGPLFFVTYVSPIAKITDRFNVLHNQYADDTRTAVRCFVENAVDRGSQQPAQLPSCRSHLVHSEWTYHQPKEIGGGTPMHSTSIKSGTAAERHECCMLG